MGMFSCRVADLHAEERRPGFLGRSSGGSRNGSASEALRPRRHATGRLGPPIAALLSCLLAAATASAGRIFTYVDERGVVHFTNVSWDARYTPLPIRSARQLVAAPSGETRRFDGLIGSAARQHRVQPALVKAVIAAESNFDPADVSVRGAQGLMQLMPITAASLGVADPLAPDENVRGGVAYLRVLLDRYGDLERALAAYNAGPTSVDRYGGVPPYPETQDYVQRVLTYYRHYHGNFGR